MSTDDSAVRKGQPLANGNLRYFPDAHLAIAELSRHGNDKHNPGEPLHWSKEKSSDHADCAARHLLEPFGIDYSYGADKPVLHSVAAAWRALANAQVEIDTLRAKGQWPLAVGPQAATTLGDGWQPWDGGECPVLDSVSVDVRFRDHSTSYDRCAAGWTWKHASSIGDIIAWRLAK